MSGNDSLSLSNAEGETLILDPRFKLQLQRKVEYNARGKPFSSKPPQKTRTKKSKNFSRKFGKAKQKTVSRITKSFTTPPIFKKKRSFRPVFRKTQKDILKKYRKFSERGRKLDFSCKNRTLVKIKKKPQPLKPRKTFLLRRKKLNFSKKSEISKAHLSASLRRKSSFPRKLRKKQQVVLQTPKFKKQTTLENLNITKKTSPEKKFFFSKSNFSSQKLREKSKLN